MEVWKKSPLFHGMTEQKIEEILMQEQCRRKKYEKGYIFSTFGVTCTLAGCLRWLKYHYGCFKYGKQRLFDRGSSNRGT